MTPVKLAVSILHYDNQPTGFVEAEPGVVDEGERRRSDRRLERIRSRERLGAVTTEKSVPIGGRHSETAVLKNALEALGVAELANGLSITEPLLLGLAGGIGGGYWVFEYKTVPFPLLSILTRHAWWETGPAFLSTACERVGIAFDVKETTSPTIASRQLTDALTDGKPAILWMDVARTAYHPILPAEFSGMAASVVLARRRDPATGEFEIDDRSKVPFRWSAETLGDARRSVASARHRLLTLGTATGSVNPRASVEAGVRDCCVGLRQLPPGLPAWATSNTGLAAFAKWRDLLVDPKDKRGWPKLFTRGPRLYRGLTGIFTQIELGGTGGGAFRTMYGEFLDEVGRAFGQSAWIELGDRYRALGRQWTDLASAALPETAEPLQETRQLLLDQSRAFRELGPAAADETARIDSRLREIQRDLSEDFPLDAAGVSELLADLSERLGRIVAAEERAATDLERTI